MSKKGDAKMRFETAISFLEGGCKSLTLADEWRKKALDVAELGDVVYMAERITEYTSGQIPPKWNRECVDRLYGAVDEDSTGLAVSGLIKLSNAGCAIAMYYLGKTNFYGKGGVEEDESKAAEWYKKAAEAGLPEALEEIGDCYDVGVCGFAEQKDKAQEYYERAFKAVLGFAENGDAFYQRKLAYQFQKGSDLVGGTKDEKQGFEWYLKAALSGDGNAMEEVSDCYRDGQGVEKNSDKALEWYIKAAENGCKVPLSVLARNYYAGKIVAGVELPKDYARAIHFATLGVELHNLPSCHLVLGRCYYHGKGVDEDNGKAFGYFKEAAELGDAMAQDYMGDCYKGGYGVEKDTNEAKKWYKLAADNGSESAKESLKKLEEASSAW